MPLRRRPEGRPATPRLNWKQDRPHLSDAEIAEAAGDTLPQLDALVRDGFDATAAHRALVRAINLRRQRAEDAEARRMFPHRSAAIVPRRHE